ncbi:hypothetical protein MMC25_007358 [Agyrium rufum]|nr:hypothetical protein [Agyrium rufum]
MAERLKKEIKDNAHRRRGDRAIPVSVMSLIGAEATTANSTIPSRTLPNGPATPGCTPLGTSLKTCNEGIRSVPGACALRVQQLPNSGLISPRTGEGTTFGQCDTSLVMFYLDHLLPFLFPFYKPSLFQGGKTWILEMILNSPVVRQATLCQSSYFFSFAAGANNRELLWETVLTQTRNAFEMLRQSLQVIASEGIKEHLHGAVRTMTGIVQVHRFEISILSFENCQSHLVAALSLFKDLLDDDSGATDLKDSSTCFNIVMRRIESPSWKLIAHNVRVPSAEQAAFRFSSTLLVFDDIIASTVLQEPPRLCDYHRDLLKSVSGEEPAIDLEAVLGCQNWVLLKIGEIAMLDAWKQQRKRAGNLDMMELVQRAASIKQNLEISINQLEVNPVTFMEQPKNLLDIFTTGYDQPSGAKAGQNSLVTRVWAHATLLYLFVVVSGTQPASCDVRYHVNRIVDLLSRQIAPPALVRTMIWPFCVAGCLAEAAQEEQFRRMVDSLQPPSVFGTVYKALDIMEFAWRSRSANNVPVQDLATCFKSQGDLVLLV